VKEREPVPMPLKQSRFWMFWGILLTVLAICLFNIDFTFKNETPQKASAAEVHEVKSDGMDIGTAIAFTRKAACRNNVQAINTMVELWYIQHDEHWPKSNMSDIGHDIDYFPKGVPVCPVTGETYRLDPVTHWVVGHQHGDIPDIQDPTEKNTASQ
jgi:hypothetical protein